MSIEGLVLLLILGGWLAVRFYVARQNERNKPPGMLQSAPMASPAPTLPTKPIVLRVPNPRPADLQQVLLHNDDDTPMEAVVHVLAALFGFSTYDAILLMMTAHQQGTALVGLLAPETAKDRVGRAHEWGTSSGFPLQFTIEPWDGDVPPYILVQDEGTNE